MSSRIDWLHLTKHTGTSWEWALLPSADHPCQGLPYIWSIHTGRYSCAELASPLSADGREREGKTRESRSEKRIFLHQSHYNAPSQETRTMQFFSDHKKQVHTHGHAREIAFDQLSRFWLCFPSDWWISGVWTDQSLSVAMQNQSGFELLLTLIIKTTVITVTAVESAVKYSFVQIGMQTGRTVQFKAAELTLSSRWYVIPLISAIIAIKQLKTYGKTFLFFTP